MHFDHLFGICDQIPNLLLTRFYFNLGSKCGILSSYRLTTPITFYINIKTFHLNIPPSCLTVNVVAVTCAGS